MNRERESHTAHLKNMEAELDAQVARIERQEREKAKLETEFEKRELEENLQAELDEMKAQLKLFQKVPVFLEIRHRVGWESMPSQYMCSYQKTINCFFWIYFFS